MSASTENQQPETPAASGESAAPGATDTQAGAEPPREAEPRQHHGAPGRGLAVFALLIALGALAAAGWQWHESRNRHDALRADLAKKLADFENQAKEVRDLAREIRQSSGEVRDKLAGLETKVAESQSQAIALEQLYQDLSRNRDEWVFAEVEQAVLIANQQLQLAGNVRAALIALESADARLRAMDRPQLTSLRKSVAHDIERLKALPHLDTVGVSARIDSLISGADGLPLAPDARPRAAPADAAQDEAAGGWQGFLRRAWAEVKQLIRIERMDKVEVPLLAPDERFFLRENLKLRLLAARVALLARDEKSFRDDLAAARAMLERFFDTGAASVAGAIATVGDLQAVEVSFEAPDLSATIEIMRTLRLPRERAAR